MWSDELPDIPTITDILGNVVFSDGSNLDKKQVNLLLRLKKEDKTPLFDVDEKELITNVIDMINKIGFDRTYEYIRDDADRENIINLIVDSPLFLEQRRNNFVELTKDIVLKKKTQSIYTCKSCNSKDIDVSIAQIRGSDEAPTSFLKCNSCGNKWTIN